MSVEDVCLKRSAGQDQGRCTVVFESEVVLSRCRFYLVAVFVEGRPPHI